MDLAKEHTDYWKKVWKAVERIAKGSKDYNDLWHLSSFRVFLDGKPASIVGFRLPFGFVRDFNVGGCHAEYSWETIANILLKGRYTDTYNFKTT